LAERERANVTPREYCRPSERERDVAVDVLLAYRHLLCANDPGTLVELDVGTTE
jgi:hypothetical protein